MKRIVSHAAALLVLLTPHAIAAQTATTGEEIVGPWVVDVRPAGAPAEAPPHRTVTTFQKDGGVAAAMDRLLPPVPPIQEVGNEIGPLNGLWRRSGPQEFVFSLYTVIMRNGIVTGYHRVTNTVTIRGDELTGTALAEFFDAQGIRVFSGASALTGRRFD